MANQEFLIRAGRLKSAPVQYHEKVQVFQEVKVLGYMGNWLKVETECDEASIVGWVEKYKINKVK